MNLTLRQWCAAEIKMKSNEFDFNDALYHEFYGVFTHCESGKVLRVPGFYYGKSEFCIRFALTECGRWMYFVESGAEELNKESGDIIVLAYEGDLDIYRHGFIKAVPGTKYFTYADGTPFFYLGDTHWSMLGEEFDSLGDSGAGVNAESHFKYIVDRRAEQGFTVYQSEPLKAPFDLSDGFDEKDLEGLKTADKYYAYIAQKGLVHANAEFFFPTLLTKEMFDDKEYIKLLCRHWVARFGAYPVLWTLAQEIDGNDYNPKGQESFHYTCWNNPWVEIAEYIHAYDAYLHPLSAHQHGAEITTVTGRGTLKERQNDGLGMSAFYAAETFNGNFRHGHTFWAAQWDFRKNERYNDEVPKDYWSSDKPAIVYESPYCYLWTKDYGARVQGWVAFLNGMYGYGYGAGDMWMYDSDYPAGYWDGVDNVLPEHRDKRWPEVLECESAIQMGYMKDFLMAHSWHELVPDFYDGNYFSASKECYFAAATKKNEIYVIYAYNKNRMNFVGTVKNLDKFSMYTAKWFNPRTNEYTSVSQHVTADSTLQYTLPEKPSNDDWIFILTKNKEEVQ